MPRPHDANADLLTAKHGEHYEEQSKEHDQDRHLYA